MVKVLGAAGVLGLLSLATAPGHAAVISLNTALTNPSFELGATSGCPMGWVCSGSPGAGFGSYAVTSQQYTAGSDGLSGGKLVPDGSRAAYAPTGLAGSGSLAQNTSLIFQGGNTYTLDFWVGLPKTEPDGVTSVTTYPDTVTVAWTTAAGINNQGVTDNLCGNGSASLKPLTGSGSTSTINMDNGGCVFNIASPGAGQWQEWQLTYIDSFVNSGNVGVSFFVNASSINQPKEVNFDMDPPAVPEPASLGLLGVGVVGLGFLHSFRRRGVLEGVPAKG